MNETEAMKRERERDRNTFPRGERLRSKLKERRKVETVVHRVASSVCNGDSDGLLTGYLSLNRPVASYFWSSSSASTPSTSTPSLDDKKNSSTSATGDATASQIE